MSAESRLAYIRRTYGVPAKMGCRVRFTGSVKPREGRITGAAFGRIRVRFDDIPWTSLSLHPTWEVTYL